MQLYAWRPIAGPNAACQAIHSDKTDLQSQEALLLLQLRLTRNPVLQKIVHKLLGHPEPAQHKCYGQAKVRPVCVMLTIAQDIKKPDCLGYTGTLGRPEASAICGGPKSCWYVLRTEVQPLLR